MSLQAAAGSAEALEEPQVAGLGRNGEPGRLTVAWFIAAPTREAELAVDTMLDLFDGWQVHFNPLHEFLETHSI